MTLTDKIKNEIKKRHQKKEKPGFERSLFDIIGCIASEHKLNDEFVKKLRRITKSSILEEIKRMNENSALRKGSRVRIRKDSEYSGQSHEIGILQADYKTRDSKEYARVIFENGYSNEYRRKDLQQAFGYDIALIGEGKFLPKKRGEKSRQNKNTQNTALFSMCSRNDYEIARSIAMLLQNSACASYALYAATPEDLLTARMLEVLSATTETEPITSAIISAIDRKKLEEFELQTILNYVLIKKELQGLYEEKNKIDQMLKNNDTSKVLEQVASKVGFEYSAVPEEYMHNFVSKLKLNYVKAVLESRGVNIPGESLDELAKNAVASLCSGHSASSDSSASSAFIPVQIKDIKDIQKDDYITCVLNGKQIEGSVVCRCRTDCIKLEFQGTETQYDAGSLLSMKDIKKRTDAKNRTTTISYAAFGISARDWKLSLAMGKAEKRVHKRLEAIADEILMQEIRIDEHIPKKKYIGMRVRIYPGGNSDSEKYDRGGTVGNVPAGSPGIIREDEDRGFLIDLDNGNTWHVAPREIIVGSGSSAIAAKYSLNQKLIEAALKNDYSKALEACAEITHSEQVKRLELINTRINGMQKFVQEIELVK